MYLWIARDIEGTLYVYKRKPVKHTVAFYPENPHDNDYFCLDNDTLFPEVTWENSPKKIELKIK